MHCHRRYNSNFVECQGASRIESSFFYRRHEYLKKELTDMGWDLQLQKFLNLVSLDGKGYQGREKVMDELETLIREEYPEATVSPFGSCTTWLADVNADLDVYVDALGIVILRILHDCYKLLLWNGFNLLCIPFKLQETVDVTTWNTIRSKKS